MMLHNKATTVGKTIESKYNWFLICPNNNLQMDSVWMNLKNNFKAFFFHLEDYSQDEENFKNYTDTEPFYCVMTLAIKTTNLNRVT